MPVSFNSPPRNLFLLGSGGQQALTNFFHTVNRASGSDRFTASDIAYSDTDQKYILAGSAKDSNSVSFGWLEKQAYDAETDPENPVNVEDWRQLFNSPATSTSTTLNFMKQTASYGGNIIIGGKTGNVPWISEYNASGVQQWVSTYQSVSEEYQANNIDLAFSSPPYFNLEKYSDEETQCMVRYRTLDEWFSGYAEPTIKNIYKNLNKDGIFATNIADYKTYGQKEPIHVVNNWIKLSERIGFKHVKTIKMMLNTRPGVGNNKTEGREKFEGVYVFQK